MSQTWSTCESLTSEQVERYLTHIGLDVDATLARSPNRALLEDVQIAHITRVPFDTSAIHLPDSVNDETFELKRGPGIPLDIAGAYINIVERSRGGYCFVLNGLFAALLRALGFRVSELTARVYMLRNKDPSEAGWLWSPTTHVCLIVDTIGEGRFLSDVGFGGGTCPLPIPFVDGATSPSLTQNESFSIRHERLPGSDPQYFPDSTIGWTLYRHFLTISDAGGNELEGHTTPCYHFALQSVANVDLQALNFFSSHSERAPFTRELVINRLNRDGSRDVLHYVPGQKSAAFYTRDGVLGKLVRSEDIPLTNAAILETCRNHFDFK